MADNAPSEWTAEQIALFDSGMNRFAKFVKETHRQRDEKLQRCLQSAVRQTHDFLDDPERVAAHNAHIDTIIAAYQDADPDTRQARYFQSLKITPEGIASFKEVKFTAVVDKEQQNASISGAADDFRHIKVSPSYPDKYTDDELQKILVHELSHRLIDGQDGYFDENWYNFYGIGENMAKRFNHALELSCDTLSDSVKTWPRWADLEEKKVFDSVARSSVDAENIYDLTGKKSIPSLKIICSMVCQDLKTT